MTRLAAWLRWFGIGQGDPDGTMGWNVHRHLESWYAISGHGAECHTINPRLFADQIAFNVNHTENTLIFVGITFVDPLEQMLPRMPSVDAVVVVTDREHMQDKCPQGIEVHDQQDFAASGDEKFEWLVLDAAAGSSLCYTSGTTADPKGVLYSHRGNLLHAYASCGADVFNLPANDSTLMVIRKFHANSRGITHAGPMTGVKLVLPGPHMSGPGIRRVIADESVTKAAVVPAVWKRFIFYLSEPGECLDSLGLSRAQPCRGAMLDEFDRKYGADVIHAWGMTEMTPIGTVSRRKPFVQEPTSERNLDIRCRQGRVPYGADMKIVDDEGVELRHGGEISGRLPVKATRTIASYYGSQGSALQDGWFDTGDIATIDVHEYLQITDCSKDVIKPGGEWISSVVLENTAMGLPDTEIAACIGARHPKCKEHAPPLVKLVDGSAPTGSGINAHPAKSIAKWQLPHVVIAVDEIPLTATGKIDKKQLRAQYENYPVQ